MLDLPTVLISVQRCRVNDEMWCEYPNDCPNISFGATTQFSGLGSDLTKLFVALGPTPAVNQS